MLGGFKTWAALWIQHVIEGAEHGCPDAHGRYMPTRRAGLVYDLRRAEEPLQEIDGQRAGGLQHVRFPHRAGKLDMQNPGEKIGR